MLKNASMSKYVHFVTGEPRFHIDCMSQFDASVSLDPAQEIHRIWNTELLEEAMPYTDALFGNNFEFESILRYLGKDSIDDIEKPLILCTCGGKGTEAVIDGEHFHIPMVEPRRVIDATGAGDSFRAGYYAGLYHGYDKHQSLVIASATASFIVEEVGALTAMPEFDQVMERADPYLKEI
jgi:sugar/nucleoside kinase (ribokinase family)